MGCDVDHLKEAEWPSLKVHMNRQPRGISVSDFYHRLFTNQNLKETMKNILMLAEIILCIPVSSAICERGFSTMARVKSDWRSRLNIDMLNILMAISIEGPASSDYNAQRALELWWHGGQRTRRPDFHDLDELWTESNSVEWWTWGFRQHFANIWHISSCFISISNDAYMYLNIETSYAFNLIKLSNVIVKGSFMIKCYWVALLLFYKSPFLLKYHSLEQETTI